jgi:hypothetical protein
MSENKINVLLYANYSFRGLKSIMARTILVMKSRIRYNQSLNNILPKRDCLGKDGLLFQVGFVPGHKLLRVLELAWDQHIWVERMASWRKSEAARFQIIHIAPAAWAARLSRFTTYAHRQNGVSRPVGWDFNPTFRVIFDNSFFLTGTFYFCATFSALEKLNTPSSPGATHRFLLQSGDKIIRHVRWHSAASRILPLLFPTYIIF